VVIFKEYISVAVKPDCTEVVTKAPAKVAEPGATEAVVETEAFAAVTVPLTGTGVPNPFPWMVIIAAEPVPAAPTNGTPFRSYKTTAGDSPDICYPIFKRLFLPNNNKIIML
jgi:hypothetical protein